MNNTSLKDIAKQRLKAHFDSDTLKGIMQYLEDFLTSENLEDTVVRLIQHEPVQYITQRAYFHKYDFFVSPYTLIPRPETEELCELILSYHSKDALKILDIGTGSGCIPITLLNERAHWTAIAVDVSMEALNTAAQNVLKYSLEHRMVLQNIDVLLAENLPDADVWVSNPPYISWEEKGEMTPQVLLYEPHIALFAGNDPLIFYKKMMQLFLKNTRATDLWLEINQYYDNVTLDIFLHRKLSAKKIEDFSGNPRFIHVTKLP